MIYQCYIWVPALVPEAVDSTLDRQLGKDMVVRLPCASPWSRELVTATGLISLIGCLVKAQSHEDINIQQVWKQNDLHIHVVHIVLPHTANLDQKNMRQKKLFSVL